jgi:hypothetical protein
MLVYRTCHYGHCRPPQPYMLGKYEGFLLIYESRAVDVSKDRTIVNIEKYELIMQVNFKRWHYGYIFPL